VDKNSTTGLNDRGVSSVQFILASGLALILFLALANLVVVQYGRGALRSALEQGARAGTVSGATVCELVAGEVIDDLLGGRMSDDLSIGCEIQGSFVVASGHAIFESWTPMTPDFSIDMSARAVVEP
jgi:hypothetical protein